MKNWYISIVVVLGMITMTPALEAQETEVMVRVKSKDAKFIGSSIGGAMVLIKNAETGEVLASGKTSGSTGDTELIMKQAHSRNQRLTDENTAGFLATLDLEEPVFVTVEAHAPYNKKQARVMSSTQLWLIPGKDITGDGLILEVPGFVVDILSPQTHERISEESTIIIKANVVMMCGCPVTPGGIWDAEKYEVKAILSREGTKVSELELKAGDKPSTFTAETTLEKGLYELLIYAFDPVSGNTGLDRTNFIVN
ncbi:hypothetical protein [Salinimicrobium sediminilitoris]|uniref:hypothetical protein n=1 Tax=Salinimicrobium sediminilitoris TaxID=2876715 RepID=UPI001E620436|nr:hypothetical protein [Salinimicrobium sediminilitoris]MCC8360691.1 hypothetical protein [Salinimicrobium sediminilitoris]